MERKRPGILLKGVIAVTFIVMVVVNALANILPINGITTGAVSDSYPNLFAPAGLTFIIWGVIYLLLALHTLYQVGLFRSEKDRTENEMLTKIGIFFSISSLINTAWIFAWQYKIIALSLVLMVMLLICLMVIITTINANKGKMSSKERLLIGLPFSVYFGWITVAAIANVTTLLVSIGWTGFGLSQSLWTVIIMMVGMLIGTLTILRLKDIAYGLVLIWAYYGILFKHTSAAGFDNRYGDVIMTVYVCIAIFTVAILYGLIAGRKTSVTN